jgi:predicted RNase H-like HicB family nuclease
MNERNQDHWIKAEQLAARGYAIHISEDTLSTGEKVFLAEHPELPGCMTQGNTLNEALDDLKQVTVDFIYYLLEDGLEVPDPAPSQTMTATAGISLSGKTFLFRHETLQLEVEASPTEAAPKSMFRHDPQTASDSHPPFKIEPT